MLFEFSLLAVLSFFISYFSQHIEFLVAIVTAIAAIITIDQSSKALKASLILNIADSFATDRMGQAMQSLRNFSDENNEIGIKTKFSELMKSKDENDKKEFKKYNGYRRLVSHHFFKIWRVSKMGLINDADLKIFAPPDEIDFLLDIIEPMHQVIDEKKYNKSMYRDFEKLK